MFFGDAVFPSIFLYHFRFLFVWRVRRTFFSSEWCLFEWLSRTVTCTRELISIYMCYSQGEGLNTSLSKLSYLVLYTVVQLLSSCLVVHLSLYLVSVRYLVPYVLDAHDEWYINYVYLRISSLYVNPNINSTPVTGIRAPAHLNTLSEGI